MSSPSPNVINLEMYSCNIECPTCTTEIVFPRFLIHTLLLCFVTFVSSMVIANYICNDVDIFKENNTKCYFFILEHYYIHEYKSKVKYLA